MTAQCSELLIYKGKRLPMFSNPLSSYLAQNGIQFVSPNTANWRGYLGTWEIKGTPDTGQGLYLTEIEACKSYDEILTLEDLFPGSPNGVFAHWYSGTIRIPQGNQLKYVHMGYSSVYEYELFMEFKAGLLVNQYAKHNVMDDGKTNADNRIDIPDFLKKKND